VGWNQAYERFGLSQEYKQSRKNGEGKLKGHRATGFTWKMAVVCYAKFYMIYKPICAASVGPEYHIASGCSAGGECARLSPTRPLHGTNDTSLSLKPA